jgi:hypothetical protein
MQTNFLARVHEGMKVFDSAHHEIGTVDRVQMSDDDPATPGVEAATPGELEPRKRNFIDNIAEVFDPDELPVAVRARLLQQGFVRIDASGLFAADRYVTPDQILAISGDELTLRVSKDQLLKKH